MAEAFLRQLGGNSFIVASAGLEAGILNPLVIEVMGEIGLDIRGQSPDTVTNILNQGTRFDYVITVCDAANAQRCPVIPGTMHKLHWSFADPATVSGDTKEKVEQIRTIRDQIREQVLAFIQGFDFADVQKPEKGRLPQ